MLQNDSKTNRGSEKYNGRKFIHEATTVSFCVSENHHILIRIKRDSLAGGFFSFLSDSGKIHLRFSTVFEIINIDLFYLNVYSIRKQQINLVLEINHSQNLDV